ncbi:PadR family transcriptional regulator [Bacillus smithii]|uniref:PadR family transcriptional regulator n=1 Tax=Bacillus smithii TaxID=1479 RepID=UPI0030CA0F39
MEIDKELLKGYIDMIILSLISKRDMYGYEIAKMVRIGTNGRFELKEGTLYLSLKRMEKRKWITSYWSDEQGSGGRRKYYRMTDEGRYHYNLKIKEWNFVKKLIDIFLE